MPRTPSASVFLLFACLAIVSLIAAVPPLAAQAPPDGELPAVQPLTSVADLVDEGPWVVRVHLVDRAKVGELATWADVWSVHRKEGYTVVQLDAAKDLERLLELGVAVELDAARTAQLARLGIRLAGQYAGIPGYPCYRTVEETYATAQAIVAAHPDLATWIDVGDSWEKTQDPGAGYDLMVLRLTQSAVPGPKPILFANFAIHAREYTTAELGTRFAEYLADGYGTDPDVTWILDYNEVHLLLQTNPDGRKMAETGLSWRKNTDNDFCSNTNSRGVDLNRNFEFEWGCCGGSSGSECNTTYRGPSPASEPEVQAVQAYVASIFPDQRPDDLVTPAPDDATGVAIDIHSSGELVLWPWGFVSNPAPNGTQLTTLGRKLAFFNGHTPQQAIELYPTDGTTDDLYYGELGIAGYGFELGTAFFESCGYFESSILPGNLEALLYAAKVARTPYQTPAGPEALGAAAAPQPVVAGDLVTLTALVDDGRFNNSNGTEPTQTIAIAEAYVDLPPWEAGAVALPASAGDGTFDETSEAIEVTLDTTGLAPGRHLLFVRGQDTAGNWGPLDAAFLDVVDPASAPTIEGTVSDLVTLAPLAATVTIGSYVTATNPATGFYSLQVPAGTYDLTAEATGYLPATVTGLVANDFDVVVQDFALLPESACDKVDFDDGSAAGWFNSPASTCTTGSFVVATPTEVVDGGVVTQVGGDHTSGTGNAFFSAVNTAAGTDDVDGGVCVVESPVYSVTAPSDVSLWYFHGQRDAGGDPGDFFLLEISTDGGTNWSPLASYGDETVNAAWTEATAPVPAGSDVQFRLQVADGTASGDLVEAGVDDLLICPAAAPACSTDPECDDGLYCNGFETCVAGSCQAGTPVVCDDGVGCTVDSCDEASDSCTATASDALCSNGLFCDGAETCDPVLDCQAGTPVVCDDGVGCTVDACNESTDACDYLPDDGQCSNGLFCDGAELCDPVLDCQAGSDPCPGLFCDEVGDICFECADDPDCDDGLFCNGAETCAGGSCQAGSDPCAPLSCDEGTDTCIATPTQVTFTSIAAEDGWVRESSETSNTGDSTSSTGGNPSALRAGDDNKDRQYKTVVSFDTSAIPDGATILSATLRLRRGTVSGTNPFTTYGTCWADVQTGGFSGSTALESGDFEAAATVVQATSLSNAASDGDWSEGNLNAAGLAAIDKTGTTQLRVYFALDDNDDGRNDFIGYYSGDNATSDNWPQLVVTYQ